MSTEHKKSAAESMILAETALREAELVISITPRMAAREAYLSMYHAAHARIAATGQAVPSTHKGVSVLIGQLYKGSSYRAQSLLSKVEAWKAAADYGQGNAATLDEAREAIGIARSFLDQMRNDIEPEKLRPGIDPNVLAAIAAKRTGRDK